MPNQLIGIIKYLVCMHLETETNFRRNKKGLILDEKKGRGLKWWTWCCIVREEYYQMEIRMSDTMDRIYYQIEIKENKRVYYIVEMIVGAFYVVWGQYYTSILIFYQTISLFFGIQVGSFAPITLNLHPSLPRRHGTICFFRDLMSFYWGGC